MKIRLLPIAITLALPMAAPAHEGPVSGARLGKVHFEVSCNAQAQKEFDLAMAHYHSFAWEHYKAPLERALAADPNCGMAHWLHALGVLDNPFTWPAPLSPKTMAEGQAALDAARKAGLKTQREKDYVEALQVFYTDHDKLNYRSRAQAFEKAMEKVAQSHANDTEARILHALFLSATFDPADKQYTNQLRAAKALEPLFMAHPEHPGAAHYMIHSYDYPPLARQGLEAAKRYAKIAPDAAHALHMPSHIFTRVGAWKESVESNRASAEAARTVPFNRVHAQDYMVYAYLQMGHDKAAKEVWEQAAKAASHQDHFIVAFGMAAMPARIALEQQDWKAASQLAMVPAKDAYPWNKYPHAEAFNAYARGIGNAMGGNAAGARAEAERLQKLGEAAAAMKIGYWVEQVAIQTDVVNALVLCADGKKAECVDALRKAAAREDASEKHPVTPGPIVPARCCCSRATMGRRWRNSRPS
jgi:hypothetical protein